MIDNTNIHRRMRPIYIPAVDFVGARKLVEGVPNTIGSYLEDTNVVAPINSLGIAGMLYPGGTGTGFSLRHMLPVPSDMDTGNPLYARVYWTSGSTVGEYQYNVDIVFNGAGTIAAGAVATRNGKSYTLNAEVTAVGAGTEVGIFTAVVHTTPSLLAVDDTLTLQTAVAAVDSITVTSAVAADSVTWKLWYKSVSPNSAALTSTIDTALSTVIPVDEVPTNTAYTLARTSPGVINASTLTPGGFLELELELDAYAAGLAEDIFAIGVELLYTPLVSSELGAVTRAPLPTDWV